MTEPQIGTIGVVATGGNFVSRAIRFVTGTEDAYSGKWADSKVNHAVTYVGEVHPGLPKQLMEAQPHGGYSFADWDSYGSDMIWLDRIGQMQTDGSLVELTPTDAERIEIVDRSLGIFGCKYGFLDIVAIAFAQRRLRHFDTDYHEDVKRFLVNPPWWVRRIQDLHHFICSQASDYNWQDVVSSTGAKGLFADNRIQGLVSPADLLMLKIED